jgi:hypothetical protein
VAIKEMAIRANRLSARCVMLQIPEPANSATTPAADRGNALSPGGSIYRNPPSVFWHFFTYATHRSTVSFGTAKPALRAARSAITWQIVTEISASSGRG